MPHGLALSVLALTIATSAACRSPAASTPPLDIVEVRGVVVDLDSDAPVSDALVRATGFGPMVSGLTSADGSFLMVLSTQPGAKHALSVAKAGYIARHLDLSSDPLGRIRIQRTVILTNGTSRPAVLRQGHPTYVVSGNDWRGNCRSCRVFELQASAVVATSGLIRLRVQSTAPTSARPSIFAVYEYNVLDAVMSRARSNADADGRAVAEILVSDIHLKGGLVYVGYSDDDAESDLLVEVSAVPAD